VDTYALECALVPVVVEMEATGMPLHPERIEEAVAYYAEASAAARECFLETLDGRLVADGHEGLPRDEDGTFNTRTKDTGAVRLGTKRYKGFNLNSQQQVLERFALLGIEPLGDNRKPTLDKKVLARYQSDELVRMLLNYRKVEKRHGMAQKLVEHCDDDGRIRARFMPLATGTGRFSSSSPNLQNIPRDPEFRCAFAAPPGRVLVVCDFSGMEMRIAAVIAGEQAMIDAFSADEDIHTRTASLMFDVAPNEVSREQRRNAKGTNFGCLYGSGGKGLCNYFATLGIFISHAEAERFRAQWHAAYPAFSAWHRECDERAQRGEHMRTVIGRRRYLYGEDNRLTTQANNMVQGTGADITKAAMIEVWRKRPATARVVATIHDEIIVECDEDDGEAVLALMLREMEDAGRSIIGDKVRLVGEGHVARSWGDAKA
jgi:DNA polymerase-1